jgi:alpha-galactosidase
MKRPSGLVLAAVPVLFAGTWAMGASADPEAPPMGWNSYDAYGTTVTEAQFRDNALWLSSNLERYGWGYAVIDMEWFVRNPTPTGNAKDSIPVLDEYGRYVPAPNRFPSAADGAGFKPLADYVHSLGLKFGIHMLRGIPKEAVHRNLPIAGSAFHAAEAADLAATCPWNPDNYGIDAAKAAGQAYYNSIAALYAAWGVDFVKADCIASHPYRADEIRLLSAALRSSGREMMLSLSPGPAPREALNELRQYADLWRISEDVWDLWHSTTTYPQGLGDQFPRAVLWAPLARPGHWPDADMLALGFLGPAPGFGKPRATRLTQDEQRTYMTLWCISRSPLMMGGNLTRMDAWTRSLLTNPEVLAVDQHATDAREVLSRDSFSVWRSRAETGGGEYLALFNLAETRRTLALQWQDLGLTGRGYRVRDLWQTKDLGVAETLRVDLPPHGAVLYRVLPE